MEIKPRQPSSKGSADMFTGDVWLDVIARGEPPARVRVSAVHFAPGARTAWHAHAVGQTLHVLEGVGFVQARGEPSVELHPGDTVWAPPGEWHWHGAAPDRFMAHLAIWEAPDQGTESDWGELIDEATYEAATAERTG